MFVPCPHCGFLVALIVSRDGPPQHCPRCGQALDGGPDDTDVERSSVEPPEDLRTDDTLSVTADDGDGGATTAGPTLTQATPAAPKPTVSATPARSTHAAAATLRPRIRKQPAPSFLRSPAAVVPKAGSPRWPGLVAIATLTLLLLVQLVLSQRAELAASDRWRPLAGAVCSLFACDLPPWHEPGAITMLARGVEPSGTPGVLRVRMTFRNDARWPQPWPTLLLTLSDVRGRPVAQRAFAPTDYRAGEQGASPLAPGQSASVQFDVVEPASSAIAFTFEFQ